MTVVKKPIRILFLSQWFDPEPGAKGLVFARELVKQGFDVEVLTGFPNYPGGKLYPGYKLRLLQREFIDGVNISRVPLYPNHDQSVFKRVLNYSSFAASAMFYGLFVAKRPDIIYAYHPPLTIGITAGILRTFRRIPVVYDVQDMWPDTLRATGMVKNARVLQIVSLICNWVYRRADRIVVLSPGFKRLLLQRGVPDLKISVIYNWADEASLALQTLKPRSEFVKQNQFCILFAGNMGKAQALGTVLQAAELLQQQGSRVCWVMLGGGVELESLKLEASNRELKNVVFLPAVPMAEAGAYMHAVDVLLVHLRKDPLFEITIPSKTQAYMAAGKPILMAVDGNAAELIKQSEGGMVADSENPQILANVAQAFANTDSDTLKVMGQKNKAFYQQHLALEVGVRGFSELFKQLALNEK